MSVRDDRTARPQRTWIRAGDAGHWRMLVQHHPAFGDDRLSLMARGVFARITELPMGDVFSAVSFTATDEDGAEAVQSALDELAAYGYLAEVAR